MDFFITDLLNSLLPISKKTTGLSRNQFLKTLGLSGFAALSMVEFIGCKPSPNSGGNGLSANGYTFGNGDIGLLNYLYVVEQVQLNFYKNLIGLGLKDLNSNSISRINDIYLHELTHVQFYNSALGTNAIPGLSLDFSSIDFTNTAQALITAENFQTHEIQAYLGVGKFFQSSAFLLISQQIKTVESRHSAYISGLNHPGNFINPGFNIGSGIEPSLNPLSVMAFYKPYIKTPLDTSTLPS